MAKSITEVLREHTFSLMSLPGVVGTAETERDGNPCVMVMVVELTDLLRRQLPSELEGYKVVVSESGEVKAL